MMVVLNFPWCCGNNGLLDYFVYFSVVLSSSDFRAALCLLWEAEYTLEAIGLS
jgi:hypothetical protein